MNQAVEFEARQKKERRRTFAGLLVAFALVLLGIFIFIRFYSAYIDETLYRERLNQMREVTTQLFSGLEDVVGNQWRSVDAQCRRLGKEAPTSWDALRDFMVEQAELADLKTIQCNLVAVDDNGAYYTQKGRQGLLPEREYLLERPERLSYVTNSMITDESRMVFLRRLETPLTLQSPEGPITLRYYGLSQNMEQLNPYFECSAYGGSSSVYVVDDSGLKLFSSSGKEDVLRGFNVLTTLGDMDYLHGTSFEATRAELREKGIAYSNALLGDRELYYSLYKMDNAAWTLIFLVPSQFVATNTVDLVNTTVLFVLVFAVALIVISVSLVFWMLKKQQTALLRVERQNSEKLEKLNVELEAASTAKTNFLSNMSHDIRTPMNAIVGITKLMDHDRNDPVKMETYIHKVQLSSQHLLSLINDVLDMSKIESSAVVLNVEKVNLGEQVGQIESIIRPQTEERNQTLTVRVTNITHENLIGDAVRLRQIFINLLSNAVKYTPNGGKILLEVAETPSQAPEKANFRILVSDNGYGMTEEFVKHIFEPFTRAENSTTNKVQGTGLGMAITKSIVDMMGGTISVQSAPGQGSRFEVDLTMPLDPDAAVELPFREVLAISDEEDFLQNAAAAFRETDATLRVARTEGEVDAILAREKVDVVLLASSLEGQTLEDNLHRLRTKTKDALLFYCCDHEGQTQLEGIAKKGGVDGVLARPLFLSGIVHAVGRVGSQLPAQGEEEQSTLQGMRFLCAEDNALNAEILTAILDMKGASCVIYPDGKQLVDAFAFVKKGQFDAILMDVQMPVMNGLDATRAIRHGENPLGKTIPIIAMTANAFSEDVQNCLSAGMDAHVAKPLDISALERTLKSVLNGKFSGGGTAVCW